MIDFSEAGIVGLLSNFAIIFLFQLSIVDGYYFFKKKERFLSFIISGSLLFLTSTIAIITELYAVDTLSLILSLIFFISAALGFRFKKTISIIWATLILTAIGFFIGFLSYLILGETGKTIARIYVKKTQNQHYQLTLRYQEKEKVILVQGEMLGFEAYQMTMKPFMHMLFGGKRFILSSVFAEKFSDDYRKGNTSYHSLDKGLFDKKALWKKLQKKKILLPGVKSVQRVMVSVYPQNKKWYRLNVGTQGLILVPED